MAAASATSITNNTSSSNTIYRPEIDGLRAFAVVAVIINHFNKDLLPSGYLGVDIFIVISGYVITSSLAGRESKNFLDFVTGFYERRIKRLIPALAVFVLLTSVLICLFNPDPGGALGVGIKALFGLSNISLFRSSTDYFAQSTELNPFANTWSLGVEEQFYLLFPFLIWFSGFGQQKEKGARNLFLSVGALTVAALTGFIYLYQTNQPAAYFLMPPRFWEMAAGCLIFIGFQKRARIEQALEQVPPLLVVTTMVGVMFLPVSAAVPATIVTVVLSAILIACLKQETAAYKLFTLEKVVFVGLISYSLYLWHWTVLCISRWTIGIHWWSVPIQVGFMILMAGMSYRYIESPLRRGRWSARRSINLMAGLGVVITTMAAIRALEKYSKAMYAGGAPRGNEIYSEGSYWNHDQCSAKPSEGIPNWSKFSKCNLSASKIQVSSPEVFWYGNSYNEQLMPAAAIIQKETGIQMNSFFASACPASLQLEYSQYGKQGYCSEVFSNYIKYFLENSRKGAILVVAGSQGYFSSSSPRDLLNFSEGGRDYGQHPVMRYQGKTLNPDQARRAYWNELIALSNRLGDLGRILVVTSGIPFLRSDPNLCASKLTRLNPSCDPHLDTSNKMYNKMFKAYLTERALRGGGHLTFVDIFTPLEEKFGQKSSKLPFDYYFNASHLSKKGALLLAPILRKAMMH